MNYLNFLFTFFSVTYYFFAFSTSHAYAQSSTTGFNVYCTSNRDFTGTCVNLVSSDSYDCILIPGQVINCLTKDKFNFQCVFVQQYTPSQSEFFCKQFDSISSSVVSPSTDQEIYYSDFISNFSIAF